MAEHYCSHPTCYASEETTTMYDEESNKVDGSFAVCGEHVSEQASRDGRVTVIMSSTNRAAEEANAAVLEGLRK